MKKYQVMYIFVDWDFKWLSILKVASSGFYYRTGTILAQTYMIQDGTRGKIEYKLY